MQKKLVSILLCVVLVFSLSIVAFAVDIAILAQPQNQSAAENETITFSISATGNGLSYRWQYCPKGSSTWTNAGVTGCKTDTITVVANTYRDGQSYRCVVTDANGNTATSEPAVLTLSSVAPVRITQQPADAIGAVGKNVMMHVAAQGDGLKYQWQYQMAKKSTWANCGLEGRLTDTLTIPVTTARDGASYRCVVTDVNGNTVESKAAKLTVKAEAGIEITAQPVDAAAEIGEVVQFSVQAKGDGLAYRWQYHMAGKTVWANCGLEGRLTDTLTVPVTAARDGAAYRCVVTNANGEIEYSDAAVLTAKEPAPPVEEGFTVTFMDYDGTVLATEEVQSGGAATLPADPSKAGTKFLGWSGNYANVTKDETVRAVYKDEKNVFVIESAEGSVGDTVTVLVSIDGQVKTCGFDINLLYDPALQLVSYDDDLDLDLVVNQDAFENGMKLNFSSASDKTKQRDIIELTFKIGDTTKEILPIEITLNSIKEIDTINPMDSTCVITSGAITVVK